MLKNYTKIVNGLKLHFYYNENAKGSTYILLYGLGVSSRYMLPLATKLSDSGSVYVIDLPGFGKSEKTSKLTIDLLADSIAAFLKSEEISRYILVGNSFGCQVALNIMDRYPSDSSAVLMGPTMNIYERTAIMQMMRWMQNLYNEPTKKLGWMITKDLWDCGLWWAFCTLRIGLKDKPETRIQRIGQPIILVRGELDPIVPRNWLEYLAKQGSLIQVKEIAGAGHALNFNSPAQMALIIQNFSKHL